MTFNTTTGEFGVARDLIAVGHDHGGFHGPIQGTGEIACVCGWRVPCAELIEMAELARLTAPAPEVVAR
jgi:hypothetical protein